MARTYLNNNLNKYTHTHDLKSFKVSASMAGCMSWNVDPKGASVVESPMSDFDTMHTITVNLPVTPQSGETVSYCVAQVSFILMDKICPWLLGYKCVPSCRFNLLIYFLFICFLDSSGCFPYLHLLSTGIPGTTPTANNTRLRETKLTKPEG